MRNKENDNKRNRKRYDFHSGKQNLKIFMLPHVYNNRTERRELEIMWRQGRSERREREGDEERVKKIYIYIYTYKEWKKEREKKR